MQNLRLVRSLLLFACLVLLPGVRTVAMSVEVDMGQTQGAVTYRASGFLGSSGCIDNTNPADGFITTIETRLFRASSSTTAGVPAYYNRLVALGITHKQTVVSDFMYSAPWPGDNNNWTTWINRCHNVVTSDVAAGRTIEYDIWNEPNHSYFWGRSQSQFFETWKRGVQEIRSHKSNAVIVGPSISGYNSTWMSQFLDYAKNNSVLPNILSWHDFNANNLESDVANARSLISSKGVGGTVTGISLNEITTTSENYLPGVHVRYFAAIERASRAGTPSIQSCAHSVWGSYGWLDGLLNTSQQTRSVWWAYAIYGDMSGQLVKTTASNCDALASYHSSVNKCVLAVGEYQNSPGTVGVTFKNIPASMRTGNQVRIDANLVPNSGENVLVWPTDVITQNYTVAGDNSLTLTLPDIGAYGAYSVTMTKP